MLSAAYCFCRMCQRWSGAPVVPWVTVKAKAFVLTEGALCWYRSSERAERGHCARCGTSIAFRSTTRPDFVDLTTASFDDDTGLEPRYSIWVESKRPWVGGVDAHLPQFEADGPDWTA